MKLTKHLARMATDEVVQHIRNEPRGLTTSDLIGTSWFHGHRTLSRKQVARLLHASGEVEHRYEGCGCRWASRWTMRTTE